MSEPQGPCGNEDDCDICYSTPRWKVSTETVRRIVHEREIRADTMEEAFRIYAEGTAWPSSYDEHTVETLSEGPPKITGAPRKPEKWRCYHTIRDPARYEPQSKEDENDIYGDDSGNGEP